MSGADRPAILFRADASQRIGGGHVMRCLTLAEALGAWARIAFLSYDPPAPLARRIAARGFALIAPPTPGDPADARAALEAAGWDHADALIVDHYELDATWMTAMRAVAPRIAVIDDLADRALDCELIVGPSLGVEAFAPRYRRLAPPGCALMLGVEFALVGAAFAAARPAALARRAQIWPPRRVLISTGFSDLGGGAARAAQALAETAWRVVVAVGGAAESLGALQRLSAAAPNIELEVDCATMAEQMLRADLMIGAPGTSSWERAALALPSLLMITADNQRDIARHLDGCGAARMLGEASAVSGPQIAAALAELAADRAAYLRMSAAAGALCAGDGARRVAEAVLELAR